jgi:HEAT repeat protein
VPWDQAGARLRAATRDPDPWVRYYAARSLGFHRRIEAVPTLTSLAGEDPVPPVRIAAVDALAQIGARDGLAALPGLADDPDPTIARQVLLAIGAADDPAASDALVRALRSDDRARQLAALAALERAGASSIVDAVVPIAVASGDAEARALSLRVLVRTGGPVAVEALIGIAEDPRRTADAVDALASLAAADVATVGLGLAHDDLAVRCAVIEALGRMSHGGVSPLLAAALHRGDEGTRVAAAYALSQRDLRAARATGAASADAE